MIIATKLLLVWLHTKHCMGGNVVPQSIAMKERKLLGPEIV
jgi:hypothetical protein